MDFKDVLTNNLDIMSSKIFIDSAELLLYFHPFSNGSMCHTRALLFWKFKFCKIAEDGLLIWLCYKMLEHIMRLSEICLD